MHARAHAARRAVAARSARAGRVTGITATLGVLLVAVPGFAIIATHGRLVLHQCVSSDGLLGPLGMRVALLGASVDCPDGAVGLTPVARTGVVLVLSLALPAVLAHAALAVGGIGLTAALSRVTASVTALLGAVLASVPRGVEVAAVGPARVVVWHEEPVRRLAGLAVAHRRRGPPVVPA